jgi:alpha-N-acetylglucosamine transferase
MASVSNNNDEHATSQYAWVTLLTRDNYLAGTRVLCRSLQNVATRYPLVILYTDTLSESAIRQLRQDNAILKHIEPITSEDIPLPDAEQHLWPHYYDIWTKLRVWQLTGYERVCFLDSDMVVLRNMDEVFDASIGGEANTFDIAAAHACTCNPLKIEGYPSTWTPENCAYTHQCAHSAGLSPPSPPSPGLQTEYFNSGFMVLLPSDAEYQAIIRTATEIVNLSTLLFADQDLLNLHFEGRILNMPYIYNALKTLRNYHSAIWHDEDVKCIHYILEKPWSVDRNDPDVNNGPFGKLYAKWWEIYDQLRAEDLLQDTPR